MAYKYVPAALSPAMCSGSFYITYGRTGVIHIDYRPTAFGSITKLPDRTIVYVYHPKYRPLDTTFDECIPFSAYEPGNWFELLGMEHTLISAHTGINERIKNRDFLHNTIKIIADSGGAQLKFATTDFVDARKILSWMNICADIGMTLDVAPRPVDQDNQDAMDQLAKMSRKLNKFFIRNHDPRLHLNNIIHGFTLEQSRKWADTVHMDGFDGWAAGADVVNNTLANIRNLLVPILEYPKGQHYHLFGFSGRERAPAMAWLGRYVPSLTSDSTSWLTLAKWRAFLTFDIKSGRIEPIPVGRRHKLKKGLHLPCNCLMCSRIGYVDYYDLPPDAYAGRALSYHNLYILLQQVQFWNNYATTSKDVNEYLEVVDWAFPKKQMIRNMVLYIDYAVNNGLDKADKKFRAHLQDRTARLDMKQLFGVEKSDKQKAFVDLPSATKNLHHYDAIDWKKAKPIYPFDRKPRKAKIVSVIDPNLNPDIPVDASDTDIQNALDNEILSGITSP